MTKLLLNAISDFQKGELSAHECNRLLIAFETWDCMVEKGKLFISTVKGEKTIEIFLSRELSAEKLIQSSRSKLIQYLMEKPGSWIFSQIPKSVTQLHIHSTEHPLLVYRKDDFNQLLLLAGALSIESDFRNLADGKDRDLLIRILDFSDYSLLALKMEHGLELILAPSMDEKEFVAVFSATDSLQAYLDWYNKNMTEEGFVSDIENIMQIRMSGHELVSRLSEQNFDGFVLNPLGPPPPVTVNSDFFHLFEKQK